MVVKWKRQCIKRICHAYDVESLYGYNELYHIFPSSPNVTQIITVMCSFATNILYFCTSFYNLFFLMLLQWIFQSCLIKKHSSKELKSKEKLSQN